MSDTPQFPLPGPEYGECGGNRDKCSNAKCPLYGALGPPRNGVRRVRGCGDPSARGKRNRRKGDAAANKARRKLNLDGPNTRHEELWRGEILVEVKAGAKAKTVETFYRHCRDQSDASRAYGDGRRFAAVASPDGTSRQLIVMDLDDFTKLLNKEG